MRAATSTLRKAARAEQAAAEEYRARTVQLLEKWVYEPVAYCETVLGLTSLEPWQCDVLDALANPDEPFVNIAVCACHGVGKTTVEAAAICWFLPTRRDARIPSTAPTFTRQVRQILWAEVHKWWGNAARLAPWLYARFRLTTTTFRSVDRPETWYAVGVASQEAGNIEGYHGPHVLVVLDEAKGIPRRTYEAIEGMRTSDVEAKVLACSTPGGPTGEFYDIFTKIRFRSTWKRLFQIHPLFLADMLKRKASPQGSLGGTYYSSRPPASWGAALEDRWGAESPAFQSRVIGIFPDSELDVLVQRRFVDYADGLTQGAAGPRVISCDVARYGRDRTVILGGEGGTLLRGEVVGKSLEESLSPEARPDRVGADPRKPEYRDAHTTARACQRMRVELGAEVIILDDSDFGVGELLRKWGERVISVAFGGSPTDKARDAEEREARERRGKIADSRFLNRKAEMGWAVRDAFQEGLIALGQLPEKLRTPLIEQIVLEEYEHTASGKIRLIDPDEQDDDMAAAAGALEGKRSPDHFHSLILYWWAAGEVARLAKPKAGRQPDWPAGARRVGTPGQPGPVVGPGQVPMVRAGRVAGQAGFVRAHYGR